MADHIEQMEQLLQAEPAPAPVLEASQPEAQPEPAAAPPPEPQAQVNEGIQKRIDELTARYYKAERERDRVQGERDAQAAQMQELVAALARQNQPPTPDPLADVHPDDKRRVEAIVSPFVKRQEEILRKLEEAHRMQQTERIAQRIGDPRVAELSSKLIGEWSRRNLSGWTEQDAVIHAAGLIALQDREQAKGAADRDAKGRFAQSPRAQPQEPLHTQAAPAPGAGQPKQHDLPTNIDDLIQNDPLKAVALLEKRLEGKKF